MPFTGQQLSEIAKFCNNYPSIEVAYEMSEIIADQDVNLTVTLKREIDEEDINENTGIILSVKYPYPRMENWWVVLGENTNNSIIAIKRIPLKVTANAVLTFTAPDTPGEYFYTLYIMSDSYLGCDQVYDIPINLK